jgi:hypothetical protein
VYQPFGKEWFTLAIQDATAFHLCLANAALFVNKHLTRGVGLEYGDYGESAKHWGTCLGQLTKRLPDQVDGVSLGIVTTVLGFLCHDVGISSSAMMWSGMIMC